MSLKENEEVIVMENLLEVGCRPTVDLDELNRESVHYLAMTALMKARILLETYDEISPLQAIIIGCGLRTRVGDLKTDRVYYSALLALSRAVKTYRHKIKFNTLKELPRHEQIELFRLAQHERQGKTAG